tara:strand:- start:13 stop:1530 length:1518 start_codon:yes stop_codon:yes gene_type:complete
MAILTLFCATAMPGAADAQDAPRETSLREQILAMDSILFDRGFNQCDVAAFSNAIADDVQFYHDQGGPDLDKAAFMAKFTANICGGDGPKPIRRLTPESTVIHPMYNNGVLYGVIQEGAHSFYLREADGSSHLTGTAFFFHFWEKTADGWKLERAFSYDHVPTGDTPPTFLADFPAHVFDNDARLSALLAQHDIPSVAFADVEQGVLRQVHVVGNLSAGHPAPVDAIYKVASLTKPVTTMTTLRLVNAGLWDLDAPLSHYFTDPDLAGDPRLEQLTTRWVLSHRSGLPNWRYLTEDKKLRFEYAPGTHQQYSGEGFEILRKALEAKFGVGLEQLARQWVFEPAGMRDTHFVWSDAVDAARYAIPHDEQGQPIAEERHYQANAAANLLTTASDYGRFLGWVARGAGLSPELDAAMMTPQGPVPDGAIPWGLGWQVIALPDGTRALQHTGGDYGIKALALIFPDRQGATLLFSNSENALSIWKKYLDERLGDNGEAIVEANLGSGGE